MVTGVETAGLVLGAIPLIISALEHYVEGVETIQKWWRYKRELASLKRVLGAEYDRFLNTLEELLAGLVPDAQLARLLLSPGGPAWSDPELNKRLQARLRNSYNSYLDTINDLNKVVTILKEKLELDPNGKPKWTDAKTFKREYKRIKFSLSKSSYEELMDRVDKNNGMLANLTHQSLRLEPARQKRASRSVPEFDRIRLQAESLYRVLKKNLCCSCNISHNANLRLEARTSPDESKLRFRMIFSYDTYHNPEHPTSWKSREADIEASDIQVQVDALVKSISVPSPLPRPSIKKGVSWASQTEKPGMHSPPPYSETAMIEIRDLCLAFKEYKDANECLGFILDEERMQHHIYPVVSPTTQISPTKTSLYTRLTSPRTSATKLTRKERLQLALILSASVLQLHKTPWLSERWSTKDIQYLSGNSSPYISRTFESTDDEAPKEGLKSLPIVRNETIFALGVSLIELCLGSSLAALREDEDLSPDPQLTDYMTARRLIGEVYDEGGGRYGDAVRRCVHCEFDQRKASLDVEAFRNSFFNGVIEPLQEDWVDFSSTHASSK